MLLPVLVEGTARQRTAWKHQVEAAGEVIVKLLDKPGQPLALVPKDLLRDLRKYLQDEWPQVFVFLDEREDCTVQGSSGGYCVWLHANCLKGRPPRKTAVLLHELVHVAGGDELDAEYYENLFFPSRECRSEQPGKRRAVTLATAPTAEDLPLFKEHPELDRYEGTWLHMHRAALAGRSARQIITLWQENPEKFLASVHQGGRNG